MVVRRLRRRLWAVLALAVLLLAGVLGAACRLTVLTPTIMAATAAADPWGPQLPRPSLADIQSQRLARLLRIEPPRKKEPAETSVAAGPMRVDPAIRLLVDQGWPVLRHGDGQQWKGQHRPVPATDLGPNGQRPAEGGVQAGSALAVPSQLTMPPRLKGSVCCGWPVTEKTALATAGAAVGTPGSPAPVGRSPDGTMWTSTAGMSDIRIGR